MPQIACKDRYFKYFIQAAGLDCIQILLKKNIVTWLELIRIYILNH